MGRRNVYGNDWSENGWPMVDPGSCQWITVPGVAVSLQIQVGIPLAILRAFAADFHAYIEPLRDRDSACWTQTNSVGTSNHLSGTALDLNWESHPFRVLNAGFDPAKLQRVRDLLRFYNYRGIQLVWWGNDWNSPKDAMHFQVGYGTFNRPDVCNEFISKFIRPDGFSTYKRSEAPALPAAVDILARATGLSLQRAGEILFAVSDGLQQAQCVNVNRIAMWLAQVGHESDNFDATAEYASGDAYDTRTDLGNTPQVDGDGALYKGRTWIQITGKTNYRRFSDWAFSKGLVPTPTYFVDRPLELSDLRWAGIGAAWYWTVARSDINELCDRGDLVTVTRRINGGTNGLEDSPDGTPGRRTRYNRALALGDQLMALLNGDDDLADPALVQKINELHAALLSRKASRSIYATPGEGAKWPWFEYLENEDGRGHQREVEEQAKAGDVRELGRVVMVARGLGNVRTPEAIARAQRVLVDIEKNNPQYLQAFLGQKGAA